MLVFALIQRQPLSEALAEAAELGWRFELDISFDEESGATGADLQPVKGRVFFSILGDRFADPCRLPESLASFLDDGYMGD